MDGNEGAVQGRNAVQGRREALKVSRRSFLGSGLAGGAAAVGGGLAGGGALAPAAMAQTPMTPEEAIKELMDGNARFVEGKLTSFALDLQILKNHTVDKQEPFAALLSCADSRVPVELIFDQSIGHLFVTRVAGNMATPEIIGSLEYGAAVLGTKAILVLGHASCGAVKATMQGKAVPGQISSLFPHIQPAVDRAGHDLERAIAENAQIQAGLLREASPVLAEMVREGHLKIVAGTYDLGTGRVTLLES